MMQFIKFKKIIGLVLLVCLFTNCKQKNKTAIPEDASSRDYRPAYHFTPDSNWINDANGLLYANGEYHLFYQYNPFGIKWGHMSWGHSVSKDLMHWQTLPIALQEHQNAGTKDSSMIFSGSAVIDEQNTSGFGTANNPPMVAIYTAFVHGGRYADGNYKVITQNQCLAYSLDKGRTWKYYEKNPVLDIQSTEFRDPKVFWYAPQQKWVMVISKPDRQEAWFYESKNLKEWNYMSRWGRAGNTARVWECPDLFELPVKGTNEKKWVLYVSAGHPQESYVGMQYFLGDFDGRKFTPVKNYESPVYLDYGKDYYAAVTYNNMPGDRKIAVGWLNNWEYGNDIPTGNTWRGIYAVPRELSIIKNASGYQLLQQPASEFDSIKKEIVSLPEQVVDGVFLFPGKGDAYELQMDIKPGSATAAGVKILKSSNEETIIRYNNTTQELTFDRTKSGNTTFNRKFPSVETAPVQLVNGVVTLRILVDKCVVELFINDGATTLTNLVFPLQKEGGIQFFSEGGKALFSNIKMFTTSTGKK
jgi:fructan beta-fructosidase